MLVILDINGVLCETVSGRKSMGGRAPDFIARNKKVFLRPGVGKFIDFLFDNFDVAVWTSCPQFSAMPLVRCLFPPDKIKRLKFIFTRINCELLSNYGSQKNLDTVWRIHPQYGPLNTLLLDDDSSKIIQFDNWVDVPRYSARADTDNVLSKLGPTLSPRFLELQTRKFL